MRRSLCSLIIVLVVLGLARPSFAVFHLTVIDEVMTSYNGDANVQFVEMRMLASLQSFVKNSIFAAFDHNGDYISDILIVPGNVTNSGAGVRWLIGTSAFQTASGVTPDFIMPSGILPTGGGLICFGGGGGIAPADPASWDHTVLATYVDCLAYGNYTGKTSPKIGTPTTLTGDGHSLQRISTTNNNLADFACGDPATPQNNAGDMGSMAATDPCPAVATPTATVEVPVTPTPTATPIEPTATATAPSGPTVTPGGGCPCDCNNDGRVSTDELVTAVDLSLGRTTRPCANADVNHDGSVSVDELVSGVNAALNDCP